MKATQTQTATRMESATRADRLFCLVALAAALTSLPPCVGDAHSRGYSNRVPSARIEAPRSHATRSVAAAETDTLVPLHDGSASRSADREGEGWRLDANPR
jgi:hypothetical protein